MQISSLFANDPLGPKVRDISMRDRERMFFLIEQMLRSGQTVEASFRAVARAFKSEKKDEISLALNSIAQKVAQGKALAKALEAEYILFDDVHRAAILAGEAANNMHQAFEILRGLEAKKLKQQRASLAEVLTPSAMFALSLVSIFNTGLNTLPALAQSVKAQGKEMSTIPTAIMGLTRAAADQWYFLLAFVVIAIIMFYSFSRTPQGRIWVDYYILRIPIYGKFKAYSMYSNMLMYFPHLIASGVKPKQMIPIMEALAKNKILKRRIDAFNQTITTGGQMSEAMEKAGFPNIAVTPVRVSENYAGSRVGVNDVMIDGMNHAQAIMERDLDDTQRRFITTFSSMMWIMGGAVMLLDMLSIVFTQQF